MLTLSLSLSLLFIFISTLYILATNHVAHDDNNSHVQHSTHPILNHLLSRKVHISPDHIDRPRTEQNYSNEVDIPRSLHRRELSFYNAQEHNATDRMDRHRWNRQGLSPARSDSHKIKREKSPLTFTISAPTVLTPEEIAKKNAKAAIDQNRHPKHISPGYQRCYNTAHGENLIVQGPTCFNPAQGSYIVAEFTPEAFLTIRDGSGRVRRLESPHEQCHTPLREGNFKARFEQKPISWFQEQSKLNKLLWLGKNFQIAQYPEENSSYILTMTTIEQIAHFAGIIMLAHHIKHNWKNYGLKDSPGIIVQARYMSPRSWNLGLLNSLFPGPSLTTRDLLDYSFRGPSTEQLGFLRASPLQVEADPNRHICVSELVFSPFMKAQFFMQTDKMPYHTNFSTPSHQDDPFAAIYARREAIPDAPHLPRDALIFRNLVYTFVGVKHEMKKQVALLSRERKRLFTTETKEKIIQIASQTAQRKGFEFQILVFGGQSFIQQVRFVAHLALAIGIHGANLVNTIFMPPESAMIEIVPYMFEHKMYTNGSGSGVFYISHHTTKGKDFHGVDKFKNQKECIQKSSTCKVFYRSDNSYIFFSAEDYSVLRTEITDALDYVLSYF